MYQQEGWRCRLQKLEDMNALRVPPKWDEYIPKKNRHSESVPRTLDYKKVWYCVVTMMPLGTTKLYHHIFMRNPPPKCLRFFCRCVCVRVKGGGVTWCTISGGPDGAGKGCVAKWGFMVFYAIDMGLIFWLGGLWGEAAGNHGKYKKAYSTQCSQVVAHLSTNWA